MAQQPIVQGWGSGGPPPAGQQMLQFGAAEPNALTDWSQIPAPDLPPVAAPEATVGDKLAGAETVAQFSPGPAKSSQEEQQRLSGWQKFLGEFESNPMWQMIAMRLGTNLMQPVPVGQSSLGMVGGAIQDSMNFMTAASNAGLVRQKQITDIAATEAGIGETRAKTATELLRPAEVQARTKGLEAEAMTEDSLRGLKVDELKQKINFLEKEGILTGEKATELRTGLDRDPKHRDAVIKELLAKANYYNSEAKARAEGKGGGVSARQIEDRADTLQMLDKSLTRAQAKDQAFRELHATVYKTDTTNRSARDIYNGLAAEYNKLREEYQASPTPLIGTKTFKHGTFADWLTNQLLPGGRLEGVSKATLEEIKRLSTGKSGAAAPAASAKAKPRFGYGPDGRVIPIGPTGR